MKSLSENKLEKEVILSIVIQFRRNSLRPSNPSHSGNNRNISGENKKKLYKTVIIIIYIVYNTYYFFSYLVIFYGDNLNTLCFAHTNGFIHS